MDRKKVGKITVLIFIVALLFLTFHFFFHGLERNNERCLLCEVLAVGFFGVTQYALLLLLLFVAVISQIKAFSISLFFHLQLLLRAPPYNASALKLDE
jgi:hypothetical protein